jgi:hypothetical protein
MEWNDILTHRVLRYALFHIPLHRQDELHQQIEEQEDQSRIEEELEVPIDPIALNKQSP